MITDEMKQQWPFISGNDAYWDWRSKQKFVTIKRENRIQGCGIYIMQWNGTDYFYIGKSKNLNNRVGAHLTGMRNGTHESDVIMLTYIEHGFPTFKVLKHCKEEELDEYEYKYLKIFKGNPYLLNYAFKIKKEEGDLSISVNVSKEEFDEFIKLNQEKDTSAREFIISKTYK